MNNSKYNFIYLFPVFNIVIDAFSYHVEKGSYIAMFRAIVLFSFIFYVLIKKLKILKSNIFIFLFLSYLLMLIPFSSDIPNSFRIYLKVAVSILMFPAGYFIINSLDNLKKLNNAIIAIIIITIIYTIISNIYNIGSRAYIKANNEAFLIGFGDSKLFSASFSLVLLPIIIPLINKKKNKIFILLLAIIVFIILLVSMRRTAVLIVIIGYLFYFIFSPYKFKGIISILGFATVLIFSFPLYKDILFSRYELRSYHFENRTLKGEARYIETFAVFDEVFSFRSPRSLFGKELFNSAYNYIGGRWGKRSLHVDYNLILHGSGIIGLLLYFIMFYRIFSTFLNYKKRIPKASYYKKLCAIFISLFVLSLFISVYGGMKVITFRSINFMYLGAILGIFNKLSMKKIEKKNHKIFKIKQ